MRSLERPLVQHHASDPVSALGKLRASDVGVRPGLPVQAQRLINELASIHDRDVIGEFPAKIEILLDKQDRQSHRISQIGDRAPDILDDGRLNPFRRLTAAASSLRRHLP